MQIRLSENIRALRRRHGLTQEQLAEALGMTPGAVYKWEAGLSQPGGHRGAGGPVSGIHGRARWI